MKYDTQPDNIIRQEINAELSFLDSRPSLHYNIMSQIKGEKVVNKKVSLALVFVLILLLTGTVAIAATILNLHIEKAMDIAAEKGEFVDWKLDDKIALINAMNEAGIHLPQEKLSIVLDADSSDEERDRVATELLVDIYGSEEHISHFTIASHDWGDPRQWTLEQQVWFWETLREKGLYTGKIKYLLPDETDLTRDQVVMIAKQAVQALLDLGGGCLQEVAVIAASQILFTLQKVSCPVLLGKLTLFHFSVPPYFKFEKSSSK